MKNALTDVSHWDGNFEGFVPEVVGKVGFYEIYAEFLTRDPNKSALEIGCGGGRHLCHVAKNYGYQPFGVDFSPVGLEKTRATFSVNGLPPPELFEADFFSWRPGRKFDLVMSHGFAEHFVDFNEVVRLHGELVADGGLLIITIPHMAHLNYLFRWMVDRENLRDHNTKIMNLKSFRRAFHGLPFEILHLDYYRTFAFPPPRPDLNWSQKIAYKMIYAFGRRVRKLVGRKRPNFLISPKIACVAGKKAGEGD